MALRIYLGTVPGMNEFGDYLSRADMAQILGVSRWTVSRLALEEGFPAPLRLGTRTLRYRADEFANWCKTRQEAPSEPRGDYTPVERTRPSRFQVVEVA